MPKKGKKGKKAAAEEAARLEAEKAAAEAVRRGVPEIFVDSSLDTSIARSHRRGIVSMPDPRRRRPVHSCRPNTTAKMSR